MPNKYDGSKKFNWDKTNIPKFELSQCSDCEYNEIVGGIVECEIYGRPRPEQYVSNKIKCPQYRKGEM